MIKHYAKIFLVMFFVLILNACTTTSRQALNNQDKTNIKSTRILLNTAQREIIIQHNNWFNSDLPDPYAPLDGGAIVHTSNYNYNPAAGVLGNVLVSAVQSAQNHTTLRSMDPIRNTLQDFNFISYFNTELKSNVAQLSWLKVNRQEIKYNLKGNEADNIALSDENTTLFIGTTYSLNSTFRKLEVVAYVKLVEKPIGKQNPRTLYANNFFFVNRLPQPNGNSKYNKAQWLKNNGLMLKTNLRDAASLLSSMIAINIGNINSVSSAPENTQLITIRPFNGVQMKGKLIKRQNDYYIIAFNDGTIGAVNSEDIIK
ncbi:hypothetical protein BH10PSE19_BH10PSE19_20620 [soil metagenome]